MLKWLNHAVAAIGVDSVSSRCCSPGHLQVSVLPPFVSPTGHVLHSGNVCVYKLCMLCLVVVLCYSVFHVMYYQIIASGITRVFMGFESLWLCARPKELFTAKKFLLLSLKCLFHLRHCEHSQLEQDLCRKWRWEVWKFGRCSQRCLQELCR